MSRDYEPFRKELEEEKNHLEKELETVGRRNPDNPSDWEAVPGARDTSQADENTVADTVEDYEDNLAVVGTLEARYQDVLNALEKFDKKTYGLCETCGKEIEPLRLEANPAARTCQEHMN